MLHFVPRILFDSCSQLSYVTPHLKRKLSLESIKQRAISIQTLGKIDSRNTLELFELCVISNDDKEIPINRFVKDICTPVTSKKLNLAKTYPHLNNIKLEDSNIDNKNLSMGIFY